LKKAKIVMHQVAAMRTISVRHFAGYAEKRIIKRRFRDGMFFAAFFRNIK
jgi:hypothetical protein